MKTGSERPDIDDLTSASSETPESGYDAWKEAKVRKSMEEIQDRSKLIPAHEVWESFGFER